MSLRDGFYAKQSIRMYLMYLLLTLFYPGTGLPSGRTHPVRLLTRAGTDFFRDLLRGSQGIRVIDGRTPD